MEIHVRRSWDNLGTTIFLFERDEYNKTISFFTIENGQLLGHRIPAREGGLYTDEDVKPFLRTTEPYMSGLLGAFQKLLDTENFPRPTEHHLKGQLEAIQVHLSDMRSLVFDGFRPKPKTEAS